MIIKHRKLPLTGALLFAMPFIWQAVYAANPVDLDRQNVSVLQSFMSSPTAKKSESDMKLQEISRSLDFKKTLHVRIQEMYQGYPVWGGDAIVHIPNGTNVSNSMTNILSVAKNTNSSMDGVLYQNIAPDLANTPSYVFTKAQAEKALAFAIDSYQHKVGTKLDIKDSQSHLVVFIDNDNKAHWAYQVNFYVEPVKSGVMPAKPAYLIDAISLKVYEQWDEIKTLEHADTFGGGFGGNKKMGRLVYDGLGDNLPKLNMKRDADATTCFLENADVTVKNYRGKKIMNFACKQVDTDHNDVYWDGDLDAVNGGYSPSNDALFGGAVIKDMYQKWYGVPVLTQNGQPMMLNMVVHDPIDNAFWDGHQMTFGDGVTMFYPLTSLGVAAHEISHGFTEQHSGLVYYGQSGGMNEAFSDMAAQAAEFYAYKKNSWQIGPEIFKAENEALRYMDKPSKDCGKKEPGDWCSIDDAKEYFNGLDVHYSSGVYNHFFYLLGTSDNWDAKKAFDVMVHANMNYWTSRTNFEKGACGVIKATKDLGFEVDAVKKAFDGVKIDYSKC